MKKVILVIFIVTFVLTIITGNLLSTDNRVLKGDAISGYHNNGRFYIMISKNEYEEVSKFVWIKNFCLWIFTLGFGIISALSMAISGFLYLIKPALSKF